MTIEMMETVVESVFRPPSPQSSFPRNRGALPVQTPDPTTTSKRFFANPATPGPI